MWVELAAEGPPKRVRDAVPRGDIAANGGLELAAARERGVLQSGPRQQAEPDLDLVHPRRVLGGVDEVEASAVPLVEGFPARAMMDVEVVPDDVHVALR